MAARRRPPSCRSGWTRRPSRPRSPSAHRCSWRRPRVARCRSPRSSTGPAGTRRRRGRRARRPEGAGPVAVRRARVEAANQLGTAGDARGPPARVADRRTHAAGPFGVANQVRPADRGLQAGGRAAAVDPARLVQLPPARADRPAGVAAESKAAGAVPADRAVARLPVGYHAVQRVVRAVGEDRLRARLVVLGQARFPPVGLVVDRPLGDVPIDAAQSSRLSAYARHAASQPL